MSPAPQLAFVCPACVEALGPGVYEGFLWGMGLMMATPFFLLLVVGGGIFHARRQALREGTEPLFDGEPEPSEGRGSTDRTGGTL